MTMSELHEFAAPYVLDALDASEREAYEAHLGTCATCRREVAELSQGVVVLASQTAETPPAGLKSRIMDGIQASDQTGDSPARRRAGWRWEWAFAAAAALAVVFAGLFVTVTNQLDRAETIAAILEAEDRVSIEFDAVVGDAEFVYSESLGVGVFLDRSLRSPTGDRVYELWLVDETGPVPAGVFRPESQELVLVQDIRPGVTLAMTEEPAGGSDLPTGDILLAAEL